MGSRHKSRHKRDSIVSVSLSLFLCIVSPAAGRKSNSVLFGTNLYRHSVFSARPSTYQNRARTISYSAEQNRGEGGRGDGGGDARAMGG